MNRKLYQPVLLLAFIMNSTSVMAVDGDVDYSAPYLWVDPQTGQISTVNPGPQPKVHTETAGDSRTGERNPQAATDNTAEPSTRQGTGAND